MTVRVLQREPDYVLNELRDLAVVLDILIPYNDGHILRVAENSVKIGISLGLAKNDLVNLEVSALLHDFGKIAIEENLLIKPSDLTPEEFREIQSHALKGYHLLSGFGELTSTLGGIKSHHEKFDGSGYPEGLSGDNIPLFARIIAVVDAFDAMTFARPYRITKTTLEAITELMRCSGSQFDPIIVEAFINILDDIS
jgi:putative two-component system response regulator